ncbi:serine protease family [Plasmopara halstedii]|uniref:Serine protease family n=1 Tax=Plasmopara halstedii TaxID=4781 RepID=A0A0P1AQE2_PLAHL|nr:serine protease family [Plasmopara halstedii]CEG43598.1 serine protease family [Plasmopara halstedii]|eukprot:XP_024579967.1 serine protease family [Plasmopara halstedii]
MYGRRGRRPNVGRDGQGIALMLTLVQQIHQLERKPPVTLGLIALMYGIHFQKGQTPELFSSYSLCPDKVLNRWDLSRVVVSGLLHVDDWHLYHNMASFLWKGYNLEYKLGSVRFLLTVGGLLVLCHLFVVVVALALAKGFQIPGPLHQCSVGFSGVIFALKVLLNHNSPAFSSLYGFQVPTKYAAWLELVVIHYMVPRSSFIGHMCGILAGYIFLYFPAIQSAAIALSRNFKAMADPIIKRYFAGINAHYPLFSIGRPPSSFKTDKELAQRLQEEEYRSYQARRLHQEDSGYVSPSEVRRRRLSRFSNN